MPYFINLIDMHLVKIKGGTLLNLLLCYEQSVPEVVLRLCMHVLGTHSFQGLVFK